MIDILKSLDIVNDRVKNYEGERIYLDTGGLRVDKVSNIRKFNFENKPSRANQNVQIGDIILARMKDTTKVKVISSEESNFMVSTGFIVLRPKENTSFSNYLKHIFLSEKFQKNKNRFCSGSTQKAINNGNFKKLKIPLPPLKTQKQIASILDNAAALRDKTVQLLKEYDLLAQSIFLEMFGDPVLNTKNHSEVILKSTIDIIIDYRGKTPPKSKKGIPLLSSANVKKGKIDLNYEQYISEEVYGKWTVRGFTKPGDLLFTTEAPVGEVALIPDDKVVYQISRRVMAIRFNKSKLNNTFALYQFLNPNWSNRLKKVTRGSTVPRVLKPDILGQRIICPSITLQNQFADKIGLIEKQKELAKQELQESEDLFNCLLQKAFKGELV